MSSGLLSFSFLFHHLSAFLHLVFKGQWNHYYCTEGTVILPLSIAPLEQNLVSIFTPSPLCLFTKNVTCLPTKQQETNKIPLCGHDWPECCTCGGTSRFQTGFECHWWVILFERFIGVDFNILSRAHNEMTQGDVNHRRGRKQAHCWNMHVPRPILPHLLYSLFQVDLLMLNYVTMVAFSGSDWPVV